MAGAGWQVPGKQGQPVGCRHPDFADPECREFSKKRPATAREIEQVALKHIEAADQHPVDCERQEARTSDGERHGRETYCKGFVRIARAFLGRQ